jgi:hypothetical protein
MLFSAVELAPFPGSVWWPKCPNAYRTLLLPGDPSVTLCSATVSSPVIRTIPDVWTLVSVAADCVTHCADIATAVLFRLTTTVWLPDGMLEATPR